MIHYLVKNWLPLGLASTIIMLSVYAVVQQDYRQSANDPQIQMAEDGATYLTSGASAASLAGGARIDMHSSLAPFVMVFDGSGKILASSGYLNGAVPLLPAGVLDYTRTNVSDRITWQPASSTRVAAVIRRYQMPLSSVSTSSAPEYGFVVAGRNIREIESRERELSLMIAAAWLAIVVLTLLVSAYNFVSERRADDTHNLL